ncbi:MAG: Methionyl-tRNA formyltransferase [Sclerophora amabilis]|nr:MAG: Methionyl-tRNA formyltransferase [Sclerophora amabilis]
MVPPLHHTLLAGRRRTGITLQTLHPHHFDHGQILAQTPHLQTAEKKGKGKGEVEVERGIDIPNPDSCTVKQLEDFLAPIGAAMLVQGIEDHVFVPPFDRGINENGETQGGGAPVLLAPKLKTEDKHVQWGSWTAQDILRRQRVLGPLWSMANVTAAATDGQGDARKSLRIILHELREVSVSVSLSSPSLVRLPDKPGTPFVWSSETSTAAARLLVLTCDGKVLEIPYLTVEGESKMDAIQAAKKAHLLAGSQGAQTVCATRSWR